MESEQEKLLKIKQVGEEVKKEVSDKVSGYILAGFGFVVGLAWNDAIRTLIEYFFPMSKDTIFAKFLYAGLVTLIFVLFSLYIIRLFKPKQENE